MLNKQCFLLSSIIDETFVKCTGEIYIDTGNIKKYMLFGITEFAKTRK